MWIRVRTGEDAGRLVALPPERPLVLGRQRGVDVIVRDPRASRRHAELRPLAGGRFLLRDLGSSNGTWVGGQRVAEAVIGAGEELRLGDVRIALAAEADPAVRHESVPPPRSTSSSRPRSRPHPRPRGSSRPTYSAIGRLVDSRARRTNRAVGVAVGVAAVAVAGTAALVLGQNGTDRAGAAGTDQVPAVVAKLSRSTVLVESLRDGARAGTGSGWVLDAREGLVVTNAHVLTGDRARIAAGGRRRSARVLAAAPCDDVALLQVSDTEGLRAAALARGSGVRQGETVVALGYPAGAGPTDRLTSTTGVVSVAETAYEGGGPDVPRYAEAVQTDTALNPGNSGGPLVDLEGRLVGMSAAVRSADADGRALQNQGFAIAVDRLRAVAADLRAGRSRAWTGLTFSYPTAQRLAEERLPAGVLVTGALAGSPGARAGLSRGAPGEALVGVDGRRLAGATLSAFCAAAGSATTPRTVALAAARTGRVREVTLR